MACEKPDDGLHAHKKYYKNIPKQLYLKISVLEGPDARMMVINEFLDDLTLLIHDYGTLILVIYTLVYELIFIHIYLQFPS